MLEKSNSWIDTVVYVDRLPVYSDQCCQKPPRSRYVSSIKMSEKNENLFLPATSGATM